MALTVRDVEHGFLRKLGAEKDEERDHVYFYLTHEGSQYTVGKLSHSWRGDLNDTQVGLLARKLRLQKREFERFIECKLGKAQVIEIWERRRNET